MTTDILSSTNTCEADEGCIAEAINEFEATQATKQYYDTIFNSNYVDFMSWIQFRN